MLLISSMSICIIYKPPYSCTLYYKNLSFRYDDFNIYPRHKKLTDEEARKAAAQLQEILSLLPKGKTEYTATKTVALDVTSPGQVNPENVNINSYGATNDLGPLESLSHTESITAAYGAPNNNQWQSNPSDIYRQMAKKQTPEEIYLQNHPNEGYDYKPTAPPAETNDYKYDNYHANTKNALQDLTPIIAALEVAKKTGGPNVNTHYTIEKSVERLPGTTSGQFKYFSNPVVQTSKYTYFNPAQHNGDVNYRPVYNSGLKVRRHVGQPTMKIRRNGTILNLRDFEIQNPLEFNRMLNV
ncbi:uncharacterized protein LOC119676306 [Teleopsis dalmanni]|uniref:uncharacterized protein LOC119676306 n=1 Tax=Teleopsis dalmanni TaxID=139649 RepID=UPI0018CEB1C8|nr:uncharacterized protein LOC119676306 [Teleopsis dalmanni]